MVLERFEIPIAGSDTSKPRNLAKRVDYIARQVPAGARILDAGCGGGDYVVALGRAGYRARGLEFQLEKVARWRAVHPGDDRVIQGDLAALPFLDGEFDAVVLNEVLEHVPDQRCALREARRVLSANGRLLVFSPNRRYPFETHGVYTRSGRHVPPLQTFLLPYVPLAVTVRLVRPWARNYWPGELRRVVEDAGFAVLEQDYVWQTFENISGVQGPIMRALAPALRICASVLETVPMLRTLGSSQVVTAARR